MIRPGFSFISIIVGLLISSLLAIILYQSFARTSQIARTVKGFVEQYHFLSVAQGQLERDLSAIVVIDPCKVRTIETIGDLINPLRKTTYDKPQQEEADKHLPFVCTMDKGFHLTLTTLNPLPGSFAGGSYPVTVTYAVRPEEHDASLSQLTRQEAPFSMRTIKVQGDAPVPKSAGKAYPLLSRIESIDITCYARTVGTESNHKREIIKLTSWGTKEQRAKVDALVPEYVQISGMARRTVDSAAEPFSFFLALPVGKLLYEELVVQYKKMLQAKGT